MFPAVADLYDTISISTCYNKNIPSDCDHCELISIHNNNLVFLYKDTKLLVC